jgi:C4-type Zn-finger protein
LATPETNIEGLLSLVHKEINRRQTLDTDAHQRKEQMRREYQPLYPELYNFQVQKILKLNFSREENFFF